MLDRSPLRAWKTMEAPGELLAGEEQPQCVSRSKENRRVRKRRHISPEAAAATIPNATGCCQSITAQDTPAKPSRNREFCVTNIRVFHRPGRRERVARMVAMF
jgi:hypothetical protein